MRQYQIEIFKINKMGMIPSSITYIVIRKDILEVKRLALELAEKDESIKITEYALL